MDTSVAGERVQHDGWERLRCPLPATLACSVLIQVEDWCSSWVHVASGHLHFRKRRERVGDPPLHRAIIGCPTAGGLLPAALLDQCFLHMAERVRNPLQHQRPSVNINVWNRATVPSLEAYYPAALCGEE
ncbi:hypothetical protein NDU88_002703 [Pleurodeles waltl]|uniref:Uncharacterized protein n=1 Tax=Pleurodeles waltl TaxID=8319 RepID=A0AAV7QA47_PLEWA|nr:hypothetical protein NDU88_002703 [Pleurodeles waltl]